MIHQQLALSALFHAQNVLSVQLIAQLVTMIQLYLTMPVTTLAQPTILQQMEVVKVAKVNAHPVPTMLLTNVFHVLQPHLITTLRPTIAHLVVHFPIMQLKWLLWSVFLVNFLANHVIPTLQDVVSAILVITFSTINVKVHAQLTISKIVLIICVFSVHHFVQLAIPMNA